MQPNSSVPHIVLEAGLPARFRYWSGSSGARYLFTRTDFAALNHFDEAVFILVRFGRIIWAGDRSTGVTAPSDLADLARHNDSEVYIHLLAQSAAWRARIVDDLKAVIRVTQVNIGGSAQILEFPAAA